MVMHMISHVLALYDIYFSTVVNVHEHVHVVIRITNRDRHAHHDDHAYGHMHHDAHAVVMYRARIRITSEYNLMCMCLHTIK